MTNKKSGYQSHLEELGIEFDTTDIGNADRFSSHHTGGFKHLEEEGCWIIHDGKRWTTDGAVSLVYHLAEQSMKRIYDEARDCKNNRGQFELTIHARRSQNKAKIDPMIGLLRSRYAVNISKFDNDPELINCRNGVLNLKTRELTPHSEDQLFMKMANANYKPQAKCPQWEDFLDKVFLGDKELIAFIKKALGYSLTGHTREHKLFLAYGLGANGKTTLVETVVELLGDYARTSEFSNFLDTDKSNVRNLEAVGMLKGVRFVTASETGSTKRWNEALIKKITGGDTLKGTKLGENSFDFRPSHKLWFQANHLPGAKDASHGFWRRIVVIPFKVKFEGLAKIPGLGDKLLADERDGIFAWLCEGARAYLAEGLNHIPQACIDASNSYRDEMDVISRFIRDRLEDKAGESIGVTELHDDYVSWCHAQKEDATPIRFFTDALVEREMKRHRTNKGVVFLNKRLKPLYSEFNGTAIEVPYLEPKGNVDIRSQTYTGEKRIVSAENIFSKWGADSLDNN